MEREPVTVAVDAMGGDHAPGVVLLGVAGAVAGDPALRVLLVGPPAVVDGASSGRVEPVAATEVVGMHEHGAAAIRAKKDSSLVAGCRLVREGKADAFFSAGNTGAAMAAATLVIGRVPGVERPAIAAVLPTVGTPCVLLDAGANADAKPDHLVQFGLMGAAYAVAALGVEHPTVALLNIGGEATKGSQLTREAHEMMAERVPGFLGNIEGDDIPAGAADVVVTDGFTGNVVLKLMEGLSSALFAQMRDAMITSTIDRLAAGVLRPRLRGLRDRLDPEAFGAAPLLGLKGFCAIGHGSSSARAVENALRTIGVAVRGRVVERTMAFVSGLDA